MGLTGIIWGSFSNTDAVPDPEDSYSEGWGGACVFWKDGPGDSLVQVRVTDLSGRPSHLPGLLLDAGAGPVKTF